MAITAGDVLFKLGIDQGNFDVALAGASAKMNEATKGWETGLRAAGAAMTAVGVAGLAMIESSAKMNAQIGQTALTLGVSEKAMRDLTLQTTAVDFPLKEVVSTFDLLVRAGVKNTDELKKSANAFDTLADATGGQADVVAGDLIPAYKALGVQLPKNSNDLDKFTWLTKNTTVDLSDFRVFR